MNAENKLVERCRKKESGALDELYKMYAKKMYGVCLRYAKNKMDAQDLLHDGFIKIFNSLNEYSGKGSFEGWMRRIMVNTSINFYRKYSGRFFGMDDGAIPEPTADDQNIISQLSTQELLAHIQNLPDGYRMVFNLYVIEGYQHNEIAKLLGISENTSKTQLMKARKWLMQKIKKEAYGHVYK